MGSVFALVGFYVLSIGPVGRVYRQKPAPNWLSAFYQPVAWLYDETPLNKPMEFYLRSWESSFQTTSN